MNETEMTSSRTEIVIETALPRWVPGLALIGLALLVIGGLVLIPLLCSVERIQGMFQGHPEWVWLLGVAVVLLIVYGLVILCLILRYLQVFENISLHKIQASVDLRKAYAECESRAKQRADLAEDVIRGCPILSRREVE